MYVCKIKRQVNEDDLKEFGTLSGYLCSQAGEIPAVGDYVVVGGYMFTVTKVGFFFQPCCLLGCRVHQAGGSSFPSKQGHREHEQKPIGVNSQQGAAVDRSALFAYNK